MVRPYVGLAGVHLLIRIQIRGQSIVLIEMSQREESSVYKQNNGVILGKPCRIVPKNALTKRVINLGDL